MLDCNMEIVCYEQQKPNLVEFIILILTHSESLKQIPTVFQKKNWKSFSNWPSFLITSNRKSLLLHIDFKKNRFPVFAITEHLP